MYTNVMCPVAYSMLSFEYNQNFYVLILEKIKDLILPKAGAEGMLLLLFLILYWCLIWFSLFIMMNLFI